MSATGARRIIESYIKNGGAVMNEESYQVYKTTLLSNWLDSLFTHVSMSSAPEYICPDCGPTDVMTIDEAINHLRIHRPEWFAADIGSKRRYPNRTTI